MELQQTLRTPARLSGKGVHTGKAVQLFLHPAPTDTGIVFKRSDLNIQEILPAHHRYVVDTRLNTCLRKGNLSIATVEHLLSAITGLRIDNLCIEIDGPEIPIMDGSALSFVQGIEAAGIVQQHAPRKYIQITRPVVVEEGKKYAALKPYTGFKMSLEIAFDHPFIRQTQQTISIELNPEIYKAEICRARTFGFLSEYEMLRQNQLGLGAGLENTLVLDENYLLNPEGLRSSSEFVEHKLLDALGDLSLLGAPLIGEFTGYCSGHRLNHLLREKIFHSPDAWEWVTG